jgi:hypothetical protein
MQDEIVLEDCTHCGGEAKYASLGEWPYLSNIVFIPAVWLKGLRVLIITSLVLHGINI